QGWGVHHSRQGQAEALHFRTDPDDHRRNRRIFVQSLMASTDRDVFINCPFDSAYRSFFYAIIYTVIRSGFRPRCALEMDDATENGFATAAGSSRSAVTAFTTSVVRNWTTVTDCRVSTCRWSWACSWRRSGSGAEHRNPSGASFLIGNDIDTSGSFPTSPVR